MEEKTEPAPAPLKCRSCDEDNPKLLMTHRGSTCCYQCARDY